mmetsp:Transcript_10039/g.12675  ORF Transcript_10039/g.12675 Transcript_10039/m.12675 type:complete len:207 (-) Transcript_10039:158-778(-)
MDGSSNFSVESTHQSYSPDGIEDGEELIVGVGPAVTVDAVGPGVGSVEGQSPQDAGQCSCAAGSLHLTLGLCATHLQAFLSPVKVPIVMVYFPALSAQSSPQPPHVAGHCSLTPTRSHLQLVLISATQSQPFFLVFPPSSVTSKRLVVSSHVSWTPRTPLRSEAWIFITMHDNRMDSNFMIPFFFNLVGCYFVRSYTMSFIKDVYS